jgi:hypothetical protein
VKFILRHAWDHLQQQMRRWLTDTVSVLFRFAPRSKSCRRVLRLFERLVFINRSVVLRYRIASIHRAGLRSRPVHFTKQPARPTRPRRLVFFTCRNSRPRGVIRLCMDTTNTMMPPKAAELCELVKQLGTMASDDAARKGWSVIAALEKHRKELLSEFTSKNLADVLWLEASTKPDDDDGGWLPAVLSGPTDLDYEIPFVAGVAARLRELVERLRTTGSLLAGADPAL